MIKAGYKLDLSVYNTDELRQLFKLKVITADDVKRELEDRNLEPKDVLLAVRQITNRDV